MVSTTTNRTAQRVHAIKAWLSAKSDIISYLCREDFTHKEVIMSHLYVVLLIIVCFVAEWIEKGGSL